MSRGLGRTQHLVLEYLGTRRDGPVEARWMARGIVLDRSEWEDPDWRLPHPTASQVKSCLRAIKTLEARGAVKTSLKRFKRLCQKGRPVTLMVELSADQNDSAQNGQHLHARAQQLAERCGCVTGDQMVSVQPSGSGTARLARVAPPAVHPHPPLSGPPGGSTRREVP